MPGRPVDSVAASRSSLAKRGARECSDSNIYIGCVSVWWHTQFVPVPLVEWVEAAREVDHSPPGRVYIHVPPGILNTVHTPIEQLMQRGTHHRLLHLGFVHTIAGAMLLEHCSTIAAPWTTHIHMLSAAVHVHTCGIRARPHHAHPHMFPLKQRLVHQARAGHLGRSG